jgi:hypothetical protein
MSGVSGGNPSSRQAWDVKRASGTALLVVAAAPIAGSAYASTASSRLLLSYYRKPLLTVMANHAKNGIVRAAARGGLGASKVYGLALVASSIANPFMSIKYAMRGDLKRAALAHYGPVGAVWLYNRHEQRMERHDRQAIRSVGQPTNLPSRTTSPGERKKPKRISREQKNRLWRMGLRWCPKHKRYDKCSLRAR